MKKACSCSRQPVARPGRRSDPAIVVSLEVRDTKITKNREKIGGSQSERAEEERRAFSSISSR